MSQENVELVRAAWEAWERGDMEAIFEFYDPSIVWDQTHYGAGGPSGTYHGPDGVKRFFREWLAAFESYYAHAEEFIDAGEAWQLEGTRWPGGVVARMDGCLGGLPCRSGGVPRP